MRRLFTLLSALSLLLCVGTCALWVRSHWRHDTIAFSVRGVLIHAELNVGKFRLSAATGYPEPKPIDITTNRVGDTFPQFFPDWSILKTGDAARWRALGLSGYFGPGIVYVDAHEHVYDFSLPLGPPFTRQLGYWEIDAVPYWLVGLATIAVPSFWILRYWLRLRHPIGACRSCGYDLRATPDRCPECGTVPIGPK
jgi:hypothetical protein